MKHNRDCNFSLKTALYLKGKGGGGEGGVVFVYYPDNIELEMSHVQFLILV